MNTLTLMRIRKGAADYALTSYDADLYQVRTFTTGVEAIVICYKIDPSKIVFVGPVSDFYVIINNPDFKDS